MTNKEAIEELKKVDTLDMPARLCEAHYMAIKALEQEPKTGHWEWVQYDYNPKLGDWHCSECRSVVIECVYKNEKAGIPLYKYCPQCGAKMVEPQESEDKCKNCEYYHNPDYTRCHKCKAESEDKE